MKPTIECSFPHCTRDAALTGLPICASHAQQVYLAVKDRLENATLHQLAQAARKPGSRPAPGYSNRPGVVYFARFGYLIKIGFSTNMQARMADLKPDEVLATMPGTMRDEKSLHVRFKRLREKDEYFLPGPELTQFIDELKAAG